MDLTPGSDFRLPEYRREVFLRFYEFTCRYRSHPGGVYYVLPHLRQHYGWDDEQSCWAAWLNANTQNPVTTLLLMQQGDRPSKASDVLRFWKAHYTDLAWDTDRRYHKARFKDATEGYLRLTQGRQRAYWSRATSHHGWTGAWQAANAIPTMGRLSAWSYLEYLRILLGTRIPDADTLMLRDLSGSKSHRNGLALVMSKDDLIWWDRNPTFTGTYTSSDLAGLEDDAAGLLAEARRRLPSHPAVGYLTLESAFCTYKSWHRPNRRYPGVYNDMLHDRLKYAEQRWGDRFAPIWESRARFLPTALRLEDNPLDPGCVSAKQNHYLTTGEVIVMDLDWPTEFANTFSTQVAARAFGVRS